MKKYTIRSKLLSYAVAFLVPILVLLLISNVYAMHLLRDQIYKANKNTLDLFAKQLDSDFLKMETYLVELGRNNDNFFRMTDSSTDNDKKLTCFRLQAEFEEELIKQSGSIEGLFVYEVQNNLWAYTTSVAEPISQRTLFQDTFAQKYAAKHSDSKKYWFMEKIGDQYYLLRYFSKNHLYYGAWVRAESILEHMEDADQSGIFIPAVLSGSDGGVLGGNLSGDFILEPGTYLEDYQILQIGGKEYLLTAQPLGRGDFVLAAFINLAQMLSSMFLLQRMVILFTIFAILLLFLFYNFTSKQIICPLEEIKNALEEVEKGKLDIRLEKTYRLKELDILNCVFNKMVSHIKDLKIRNYEEKLESQRNMMNCLRLQIGPHFMMNGLNIVYNYARINNMNMVKEMTMLLVNHYRYTLYSKPIVTIEKELAFSKNYLNVQNARDGGRRFLKLETDLIGNVLEVPIPILGIQTFVENSIKNTLAIQDHVLIKVTIAEKKLNAVQGIFIQITDNGPGFSLPILQMINQGKPVLIKGEEHIGISNFTTRAAMIYKNQFIIHFYNHRNGGAVVELWIPKDIGGMQDESFNC